MSLRSILDALRSIPKFSRPRASGSRAGFCPRLEALDERTLPSFTPVASFAGGNALAADFNNDGVPDLVPNAGSVLLGNGDGTFDPAPGPTVYGSAVGDLDGDGNLDLVATSGSSVNVLMGNGDGTFTAGSTTLVTDPDSEEWVGSVAVGDFDGDGNLDLGATSTLITSVEYYGYYWSYYTNSAHVLLGNGSGSFSGPNTTELGNSAYIYSSGAAADFNGDGIDDFATVEHGYGVSVFLGDVSGFLQMPLQGYAPDSPTSLAVADVDGDLDPDQVTANYYGSVSVRLGNGGGQDYTTGPYSGSVALADFNGDGKLDIVTTSNVSSYPIYTGQLNVLFGYGDGTFAAPITQSLEPGAYASGVVAADFDGDGLADLAVTTYASGTAQVNVYLNAADWSVPVTVTISDATVTEGNSGTVDAVFTVTRKGNLSGTLTVYYHTGFGDATAGSDYVAQSGTLTFAPGESTKTIKIKVKGDVIDEYDQIFGVYLGDAPGATITDGLGIGTILDNDPPPTVTITPKVSAKEGNSGTTTFKFFVTLSAPSEKEVRVNFATANGTASTADNDYVANSGTLVFAPGQTSKNIQVVVKGDKKKEAKETFFVNLTAPTNATLAGSQGIGEILDDDTH